MIEVLQDFQEVLVKDQNFQVLKNRPYDIYTFSSIYSANL